MQCMNVGTNEFPLVTWSGPIPTPYLVIIISDTECCMDQLLKIPFNNLATLEREKKEAENFALHCDAMIDAVLLLMDLGTESTGISDFFPTTFIRNLSLVDFSCGKGRK